MFCFFVFYLDREDISEEPVESIDQVAVLTSNVLFFIVMFIFAVFETYVCHSRFLRNPCHCPASPYGVSTLSINLTLSQNFHPLVHGHVCLDEERSCALQRHHHLLHWIRIHFSFPGRQSCLSEVASSSSTSQKPLHSCR